MYVTATSPSGLSVTSGTVTFTVNQTPTSIQINPDPSSVALTLSETLAATELDQFGVALATQPTLTWSKVSGGGSISGTGATNTFTAGAALGTTTIQVTDGTITQTGTVHVINNPPTVATPAAANGVQVQYTTTATSVNLTVLGAYAGGESNLTYFWNLTSAPAGVTFSANTSNAAKNTTATFTKAGTYDFHVKIYDAAGGVTGSDVEVIVNQVLTTIVVTPGPTDTEQIGSGTQTYTATGYGQFGLPMATAPTFTWSNTGVGSVNSGTGVYTIGNTPGTAVVTATSGTVSGSTTVTVTDVAPTVGTAATASPDPVTRTTTRLTVAGQYIGTGGLTYTWAVTSGPSGVTYTDNGDSTASATTASFTQAGTYTFTVTIADNFGGSVTSLTDVTVDQTPTTITITPNPATVTIGGTINFSASMVDQFGNAITGATYGWTLHNGAGSVVYGTGVYSAPNSPGSADIQATSGGATTDASVTITDVAPTVGTITVSPNPVTGTTATFTVTGDYTGTGNLTYNWLTTGTPPAPISFTGGTSGAPGSAVTATGTFTKAGTYTVLVTVSDGFNTTTTQTVTFVVNQTPTSITAQPLSATITAGTTQQFLAAVNDQFGDPLATQPTITWTKTSGTGTITAGGLYTAPNAPGSALLSATGDGLTTAGVNVTVVRRSSDRCDGGFGHSEPGHGNDDEPLGPRRLHRRRERADLHLVGDERSFRSDLLGERDERRQELGRHVHAGRHL